MKFHGRVNFLKVWQKMANLHRMYTLRIFHTNYHQPRNETKWVCTAGKIRVFFFNIQYNSYLHIAGKIFLKNIKYLIILYEH